MKLKIVLSSIIMSSALFLQCKKDEQKPKDTKTPSTPVVVEDKIRIGETYLTVASARAVVYTDKTPETGYNRFYVAIYDSADGSRLSNGHFDMEPIMDMGSMQHGSPVENSEDTLAANGFFRSAVVFSMPGTSSQWKLNLSFHNHKNELLGTGTVGVEVKASSPSRFNSSILALDSNKVLYISYVQPTTPTVGINDFEIVVNEKRSAMDYRPAGEYAISIEPTMPSMGHGSPNNVDPVHTGEGHYLGKVNFTMTGTWRIKLKISRNGILLSEDQYFDVTLQ